MTLQTTAAKQVFRRGNVSAVVYINREGDRTYVDTAVFRRIKVKGEWTFRRGANMKPDDIPDLIDALTAAREYIEELGLT